MATLRGEGKTDNRVIAANPRGTLAVEGLDGATTFTRDAAGNIIKISMVDEWGRTWYKTIDRDTSEQISRITAWSWSTSSTVSSATTATTISSATTATSVTTASSISTASTGTTVSTVSTT